jgi:hypothetical protein
LLGKSASIVTGLPCVRQKNKTTPSATTLDVVEVAPHMSTLHKLGRTRTDGSNLLRASAGITAGLPCFWQKRNYPECGHSRCSRGGSSCEPFQRIGCKPVERIDFVGVNATTVECDHPRPRRRSIREDGGWGRGLRQNTKSRRYERGCSLRKICDKTSIYISTAHDSSLLVFIKEFPTRILWHIASKLI